MTTSLYPSVSAYDFQRIVSSVLRLKRDQLCILLFIGLFRKFRFKVFLQQIVVLDAPGDIFKLVIIFRGHRHLLLIAFLPQDADDMVQPCILPPAEVKQHQRRQRHQHQRARGDQPNDRVRHCIQLICFCKHIIADTVLPGIGA